MHCLNLKLTYDCTNDCAFCFSSYMKNETLSFSSLLNTIEKGYRNGAREIVLSGGEPTIHEEKFLKCLELADSLGYEK